MLHQSYALLGWMLMKKCKCLTCGESIQGSNSTRIKKKAALHCKYTGHRSYRKVVGWGNFTFPKRGATSK